MADASIDRSYTAAFRRYSAFLEIRDFTGALEALDEAVEIEPDLVAAYQFRGLLWRLLGDYVRASRDHARCLELDAHYVERDLLQRSAQSVIDAFRTDPVVDERWESASEHGSEIRRVLQFHAEEASRRRAVSERPACNLPCPSLCCHFDEESFFYGVHIRAAELASLRALLRDADIREAECVSRVSRRECPERIRARDECFVLDEDGEEHLYYPLRSEKRLGTISQALRPRMAGGAEIGWVTARSRGCSFLTNVGCLVHDIGDPPGLTVCRRFLCLTGLVFTALRYFGVVVDRDLEGRTIEALHEDALVILPLLARVCADPETGATQAAMRASLAVAIEAEARGDPSALTSSLQEYEASRIRLEQRRRVGLASIRTLFDERTRA